MIRSILQASVFLSMLVSVTASGQVTDATADDTPATKPDTTPATKPDTTPAPKHAVEAADEAETVGTSLEDRPHRIDAGVFLGGNFLGSGVELGNAVVDDQVPTSAFMFGFRGTYLLIRHLVPGMSLDPRLSVEIEGKLAVSSTAGNADFMRDSYSSPVLGWRAHAVVSIMNDRNIRPFALLGFGGETAFSSSPFVDSVDTDAELHWGVGATYQIAPRYGVRGDFRHGITAGRFSLAASTVEIHAGFYYNFGFGGDRARAVESKPDSDRDPQLMNSTPDPEPPPAPVDTDGDGITDDVDKCPDKPETVNQIDDTDGCPELDQDGDGILDTTDECPEKPEDMDGFEDDNGCPDKDNDNDGRVDAIDACPGEPEALNGFEDDDGCTDEIPPELTAALKSIRFRPRGTQLKAARKQLSVLAALLKQHPSVRLQISGHTNDKEKKAKALSERRADKVKANLVAAGIEASRLQTAGFGAYKPVASNKTRAGKTLNRRVDFELIPGPATLPDPTAKPKTDTKPETDATKLDSETKSDIKAKPDAAAAPGQPSPDQPDKPAPDKPATP